MLELIMKFKTLFKCLSGLTACSSFVPLGQMLNNNSSFLSSQNVITGKSNAEKVEAEIEYELNTSETEKWYVAKSCSNYDTAEIAHIKSPDSRYPVTEIGSSALARVPKLSEVILPDTITKIGFGAFAGDPLKTIDLPSNLVEIAGSAFTNTALESINIPSSVKVVGYGAFIGCKSLKSILLNWNLEELQPIIEKIQNKEKKRQQNFVRLFSDLEPINKIGATIHIIKSKNAELKNTYQTYFQKYVQERDVESGVGLDLSTEQGGTTTWIDDIIIPTHFNKWGLVIGIIFSSIMTIGLVALVYFLIKNKKSKTN